MRVKYLGYWNKYQYKINGNESDVMTGTSCFSNLFGCVSSKNDGWVKIWVCSDNSLNNVGNNNYCLINEKELKFYFSWVKYVTGINFSYKKSEKLSMGPKLKEGYLVTANFKNKSNYLVKLFVTLIRNCYESPFNIQLKTAILLKDIKGFKHLSFTERLMLAINSITDEDARDVHAIYRPYCFIKIYNKKNIKKRILSKSGSISSTLEEINHDGFKYKLIIEDNEGVFKDIDKNMLHEKLIETLKNNYKISTN